jgi:hypothetical protein
MFRGSDSDLDEGDGGISKEIGSWWEIIGLYMNFLQR